MQLSRDELKRAYRRMFSIRTFETRVEKEFAQGNIPGFAHVYLGQEASAVGVCHDLADDDYIGSTHRGHGHCIAKGVDVKGMMAEIYGRITGSCRGKGGSMHIADLSKGMLGANGIVGGGPPLICGRALASKLKGDGGVAVAFFGDGASNQGTTLESLNLASIWNLPVVFVAENNGYAEATSSTWSVATDDIADRAAAFGMPGVIVDGFDFFAAHEAAGEAVARAREGGGGRAARPGAARDGPGRAAGPIDPGSRTPRADAPFRIGNAAGEAHPIIGEGMSMALQSAWLLCAQLIDPARRDRPPDAARQRQAGRRYARLWRRHFGPRLRLASLFAHAAMRPHFATPMLAVVRLWPGLLTAGAVWVGKVRSVVDADSSAARRHASRSSPVPSKEI